DLHQVRAGDEDQVVADGHVAVRVDELAQDAGVAHGDPHFVAEGQAQLVHQLHVDVGLHVAVDVDEDDFAEQGVAFTPGRLDVHDDVVVDGRAHVRHRAAGGDGGGRGGEDVAAVEGVRDFARPHEARVGDVVDVLDAELLHDQGEQAVVRAHEEQVVFRVDYDGPPLGADARVHHRDERGARREFPSRQHEGDGAFHDVVG